MPTPDISIRRLGAADLDAFRAIRLEALATAPQAFGSTLAVAEALPPSWYAERLAQGVVLAAFAGGTPVGMAGLYALQGPKDRHKGVLWGLYVRPSWGGRGIGAALVRAVLDHAAGLVEQVHLSVVRGNGAAQRMYAAMGFVEYGVEPRALKTADGYADEVLMVRFLDA